MFRAVILFILFSTLMLNAQFAGGDGTLGDPYQISSAVELQNMNLYLDADYKIMNDIDASATTSWNSGAGFISIGNSSNNFTGSLDGQDFTISDLFIYNTTDHCGLFGVLDSASVSNIALENVNITGSNLTGSLAGSSSFTNISNCHSSGTINSTESFVGKGGLIGKNEDGIIENSHSSCDVTGSSNVGGFVGVCQGDINNCYSSGYVLSTGEEVGYAGGFAGVIYEGNVSNCYSLGNVTSTKEFCGGFTSYIDYYKSEAILTNCYSTGLVTGENSVGGFIGAFPSKKEKITVTSCYWDTETSGQTISAGGTGKTTVEMNNQFTFIGWDFISETTNGTDDYWGINPSENSGYPFLSWQDYDPIIYPEVTTPGVSDIRNITATGNGNLISLGVPNLVAYGVCWNTSGSPSLADNFTNIGAADSIGIFSTPMTDLLPKVLYYVRAYTTNSAGTIYGNEVSFTTNHFFGSGTEADPFQITNVEELQSLNTNMSSYYKIMNDIDASETTTWNSGEGFIPIGNYNYQFTGTLEGQNYTISDLYINRNIDYSGLIGCISNGKISNIKLEDVNIMTSNYTGALIGTNYSSVIYNCHSSGSIVSNGNSIGGLAGRNFGIINNCSSSCNTTGEYIVGGFIGYNSNTVLNSYSTGNAESTLQGHVGGFIGNVVGGLIYNCYSLGNATSNDIRAGGFIAYISTYSTPVTIRNCYSKGFVSGTTETGGFTGKIFEVQTESLNFHDCCWDKQTSGQTTSAGEPFVYGKTTSQMQLESSYSNWDFATPVWEINSQLNNGYPYLSWQTLAEFGIPQNVITSVDGSNLEISWDPVEEALSYSIHASYEPYSGFSDLTAFGTFNGTTWTIPFIGDKMFYYVVSNTQPSKNETIENVTKEMIIESLRR